MNLQVRSSNQRFFAMVLIASALFVANSATAKELTWENLVPPLVPYDHPFKQLSPGQLSDMALLVRVREQEAAGRISDDGRQELAQLETQLAAEGVNVDSLLERRQEVTEKRRAAAQATVSELDGQQIRMPGFLLPLEFTDTLTTEFLLVPYVGACIHVPPPPPNQIVHVRFDKGFRAEGLFTPVWVQGEMTVGSGTHELYLADGAGDVDAGYRLVAESVEQPGPAPEQPVLASALQ